MARKGCFIVVEGPDGSGKSTVVKAIAEYLSHQDIPSTITRELGGTPFAERIRDLILNPSTVAFKEEPVPVCELMLAWASRVQHLEQKIIPALERGDYVVTDRYYWSTRAYQGGRGAPANMVADMEQLVANQYREFFYPDIIFYLDVSKKESAARLAKRTDGNDRLDSVDAVAKDAIFDSYYDSMMRHMTHRDRAAHLTEMHRINADAGHEEVMQHVKLVIDYFRRLSATHERTGSHCWTPREETSNRSDEA